MFSVWKKLFHVGLIFVLVMGLIVSHQMVKAETLEEIEKQMSDLQNQMELSMKATTPLESEVAKLSKQLAGIQAQIVESGKKVDELRQSISLREGDIKQKYSILAAKVRDYYKKNSQYSPLLIFVSSKSAGEVSRGLAYKAATADEDKNLIITITTDILKLESDKKKIETDRARLAGLQAKLDTQKAFFEKEIAGAKKWQAELSTKIAVLSAKQQAILSEKSGTFQTTVGDVPLADDLASRPDYNPGFSPAFAAFSFGAPHFNGLSQYGAYGRAKQNQLADQILKAYYGDIEIKKDYDQNAQICVGSSKSSCTNVSLETYAKRIYEMPGSWGDDGGLEALKAQAVAARSYALADMARNGFICSTESCQVYKPQNKGGKWDEAVNATAGWVMMKNGKALWAKYASTAGGYIEPYTDTQGTGHTTPGFWDTANGREGWTSQAYEKVAGSPWFYKAWYRDRSKASCGKSHPWLSSEEMADILNAWVVISANSDDRVIPIDYASCFGKSGNPYSMSELRDKGGYSSVSGVSVSYGNDGVTANVTFQTNKGPTTINGNSFYKAFNLRAPGKISLKSGLFNIEKK